MWNYIKSEPAIIVSGLVPAVIALVTSFGFELTAEQTGAIVAIVAVVLSIVTRQTVTPNPKVIQRRD